MNNGKRLDQLTKEELIEKVKVGRQYYHDLNASVETLTDENATLIREKEALTESIAERDKQIANSAKKIKILSEAVAAAYDLIPVSSDTESES